MDVERALIRAVCQNREDDLPRLAYADWCEETGHDLRAGFIRTQLELAKLPPKPPLIENVQSFSFQGGKGSFLLYDRTMPHATVGKRIDVTVQNTSGNLFGKKIKDKWHGLLVTGWARPTTRELWVEFTVDHESKPWVGQKLYESQEEYLLSSDGYWPTLFAWIYPVRETGIALGQPWTEVFRFNRGFVSHLSVQYDSLILHAKDLFSYLPIETLNVLNIEPFFIHSIRQYGWYTDHNKLPEIHEVWKLIEGHLPTRTTDTGEIIWKYYLSPEDAKNQFNRACVRYGRIKAGLEQG